jgi:16S rRNA U1498 N3-methylase RsmE
MKPKSKNLQKSKISQEFQARLDRLNPEQKVRAIIILDTESAKVRPSQKQSQDNRKAAIEAIRQSAEQTLTDIDKILERFSGKRLGNHVDALGSISIEANVSGINALAALAHVKAILEDQALSRGL